MRTSRFNQSLFNQLAVEGISASGAKGIAPDAGHEGSDPDWQPV